MIHAHIDYEIKGDHSWDWQEQEAHEDHIAEIIYRLKRCIESSGLPTRTIVYVNVVYYPDKQKFSIIKSTRFIDEIKSLVLKDKSTRSHFI